MDIVDTVDSDSRVVAESPDNQDIHKERVVLDILDTHCLDSHSLDVADNHMTQIAPVDTVDIVVVVVVVLPVALVVVQQTHIVHIEVEPVATLARQVVQ